MNRRRLQFLEEGDIYLKNAAALARLSVLLLVLPGCSSTTNGPQQLPNPTPIGSGSQTISRSAPPGGWSFRYSPGTTSYRTTRVASIETQSDSGLHREISTNTTNELISLETGSGVDTMLVSAVADSFSTTTQGRIGSVQLVQLPVRITATFSGNSITITGPAEMPKCDPVASMLASDLRNLLPSVPAQLAPGLSWVDSIQTSGCQAGIPTILNLRRSFLVSGEMSNQTQPLLVILRTDSISARGEGSQLQHRVALQAEGTGRATYHFDLVTGKVVELTTSQDLNLSFSASARTTRFHETSQQTFLLSR
jgi:hypothetical protein